MARRKKGCKVDNRDWRAQNGAPESMVASIVSMILGAGGPPERTGAPGRPREYPDEMVEWGAVLKASLGLGWRQAHGLLSSLLKEAGAPCIGYTQFYDRAKELAEKALHTCEPIPGMLVCGCCRPAAGRKRIVAAVDATGLRLNEAGKWRMKRWDGKDVAGWIKVHAAVDTDTNEVLAFAVTTEGCGDNTCFMRLMDLLAEGGHDVAKVLADAAYDDKDNWNEMRARGIDFKANIKKSCKGKFKGCAVRGLLALRREEIGEQAWKLEIGYGRRWKVECAFSDLKRLFGFMLKARLRKWMAFEVYWRIRAHNVYKGALMGLRGEVM